MARKLNALSRTKAELKAAEVRLRYTTTKAVERDKMQEDHAKRLATEIEQKNKTIAANIDTILRRDETIQQRDNQINHMIRERDTIIRIVDQFTSLQITPLGSSTTLGISNSNLPKDLRRG